MTVFQELLGGPRVVAVLRAPTADRFPAIVETLYDAGIRAVEITMTSSGAEAEIARLGLEAPVDLIIGAGTVRSVERAHMALDAGARFLVSQVTDERVDALAREAGVLHIPGALTPNEIVAAWDLGVEAVKVSPIGPLGGLDYFRELRGPLPDIPLFPTGGVDPDEAPSYLSAGAALIGVSGALLRDAAEPGGDLAALTRRTRRLMEEIRSQAAGQKTMVTKEKV